MHALDVLSKKCEFGEVTAAVYRDEYVRDSFIRGLQSSEVRQRLLEDCGDRKTTFNKARTLELAFQNNLQIQDKAYVNATFTSNTFDGNENEAMVCAAMRPRSNSNFNRAPFRANHNNACYFCGHENHPGPVVLVQQRILCVIPVVAKDISLKFVNLEDVPNETIAVAIILTLIIDNIVPIASITTRNSQHWLVYYQTLSRTLLST